MRVYDDGAAYKYAYGPDLLQGRADWEKKEKVRDPRLGTNDIAIAHHATHACILI
jgi:hypothetical protein